MCLRAAGSGGHDLVYGATAILRRRSDRMDHFRLLAAASCR
jgi:hypothetical protein